MDFIDIARRIHGLEGEPKNLNRRLRKLGEQSACTRRVDAARDMGREQSTTVPTPPADPE